MDAQQQHDEQMAKRGKIDPKSKGRLEALLKSKAQSKGKPSSELGTAEWAVKNYPGLTKEKAQEMVDAFGG
jgi:hypothetical protein